jgi:hypothetical protein
MLDQKVDFNAVAREILDIMHRHGLTPNILRLIINVPDEEFEALALQYPDDRHPHHGLGTILIRQKNNWFVQVQPILKLDDYPTGEMLKPSSE